VSIDKKIKENKGKENKRNINIDLAILPSHDKYCSIWKERQE